MVDTAFDGLSTIRDSLTLSNLLIFAGFFCEFLVVSKSAEICRFLVSGGTLPHQC
jgi:hypothetical protein